MRMSMTAKERDKRNREIRKAWESRLYSRAEIARQVNLTLERVRQILNEGQELLDDEVALTSSDLDWDTIKKIRGVMKIPVQKSTHLLIESQKGIYSEPRKSLASIEYFVYVLAEVERRLFELKELLEELEIPED